MPAPPQDDLQFTRFHAKATGLVALAGVLVLLLAEYLLPRRPAGIVGGLGLLMAVLAAPQCLFQSATLVSHALHGQRRRHFQVAVSLAVAALIGIFLVSRVDAMPVDTLWRFLTPWLILPLAIIATVCWHAGGTLDQEHPFRGFVIAAAIVGALCWFWTLGGTSGATDSDEGGGGFYLDPEQAQRARETGEYVWLYLLYTSAAYSVLFYRWRRAARPNPEAAAFRELNEALTPDAVDAIVSSMSQHISQQQGGHGRKADLPVPQAALEVALVKAILTCTDPKRRELLRGIYIRLDDYLLSDEECAALDAWDKWVREGTEGQLSDLEIAKRLSDEVAKRAQDVRKKLSDAMHRRARTLDTLGR